MTAQKGRSFIIQVDNGSGTFNSVGGCKNLSLKVGNEIVDVTNADDSGIRKLLEGAGVTAWSLSFSGVYLDTDTNGQHRIKTLASTNAHANYKITVSGSTNDGTWAGSFAVSELEFGGEFNSHVTTSFKLESAGAVTFTATA